MKTSTIEWHDKKDKIPSESAVSVLIWNGFEISGGSFIRESIASYSFRNEDGDRCKDCLLWAYYPEMINEQ